MTALNAILVFANIECKHIPAYDAKFATNY